MEYVQYTTPRFHTSFAFAVPASPVASNNDAAKAEDGTVFTGAYARRFADMYDNLQTGFARNLIKDGKISAKDIADESICVAPPQPDSNIRQHAATHTGK